MKCCIKKWYQLEQKYFFEPTRYAELVCEPGEMDKTHFQKKTESVHLDKYSVQLKEFCFFVETKRKQIEPTLVDQEKVPIFFY